MSSFRLGPITLASCWKPVLHPAVRALEFPAVEGIDCFDCLMVKRRSYPARSKCCVYVPALPNFLVGEILDHGPQSNGEATVAAWVAAGRGDPLFVNAPPALQVLFREARQDSREALACPLLDADGLCSIYEHRPYLCIGHHCRYPYPPEIAAFWNCLTSLLALTTALVAQHLLMKLGIDVKRFTEVWASVKDENDVWTDANTLDPRFSARLWQHEKDPADFYRHCFHHVMETGERLRAEVEEYRRWRLGRTGAAAEEPAPTQPPEAAHNAFMEKVVAFDQNTWTLTEHEGFVLWYHNLLWGRRSKRGIRRFLPW